MPGYWKTRDKWGVHGLAEEIDNTPIIADPHAKGIDVPGTRREANNLRGRWPTLRGGTRERVREQLERGWSLSLRSVSDLGRALQVARVKEQRQAGRGGKKGEKGGLRLLHL